MSIDKDILLVKSFKSIEFQEEKTSLHINPGELDRFFSMNKILALKIANIKINYEKDNKLSSMEAYDQLECKCQISASTMKSTINGKIKPTRNFLYKLTVGLNMSLDEANDLFSLCGGTLSEECLADYICIKALEDGDEIGHFIEQFEENTKLKLQIKDKKLKF